MYFITKAQWDNVPAAYRLERSLKGARAVFEGSINHGQGGTTLICEHEHFEIIDTGDPEKDALTVEIINALRELPPDDRAAALADCRKRYEGRADIAKFTEIVEALAD